MPLPYGGITVTVQRAVFDRWNDATYTDHHQISGCLEYPASSTEADNAVTDSRVLLAPNGADILSTDRILIHGLAYQVQGLPKSWTDPFTGWDPGMQVDLVRVS